MSLPAVKLIISTGQKMHSMYPVHDMSPVPGLDSDLKWFIKRELNSNPIGYDKRIFQLVINESITSIPDIEFSHLDQYQISYNLVKKADLELQTSVENAESQANETMLPYKQQLKIITLGLGVLFRALDGTTYSAKEQIIVDKVMALAFRIWNNDTTMKTKIQEIIDGTDIDLDLGWEKD